MDFLKRILTPRIIFIILGLVIAAEVVVAIVYFRKPPTQTETTQAQKDAGGKIILVKPLKQFSVGENIPVRVIVNTGGVSTDGVDLVLKYDPKVLEASSSAQEKGAIYSEYPLIQVVDKEGLIRISGIVSVNEQGFNGNGIFAVLNFKAKAAGSTSLTVDFSPGQTHESNIVQSNTTIDILEKVYDLDLTIK